MLRSLATIVCLLLLAAPSWAQETEKKPVFSGKYTEYTDTYNGYKLKIPVEFVLHEKGASTDWTGPLINGMATSMAVNVVEMPRVHPQTLYDANLTSMKDDRFYTEETPVKVKFAKKTALGFTCKEVNTQRGTTDPKTPDEHHRWHLYVFGNDRAYTCGFSANFKTFQDGEVQPVYREVIKSFELVPAALK
ncbi:MAG: hypothetical protein HY319_28515 [Armatimonadetes bacterium]|nr:hypothetical protein [Armatimonadota bacterium]